VPLVDDHLTRLFGARVPRDLQGAAENDNVSRSTARVSRARASGAVFTAQDV
jgi:hypothetical protein